MADSAMSDLDFNFFGSELAGFVAERFQRRAWRSSSIGFDRRRHLVTQLVIVTSLILFARTALARE
jgi:hypothetical protein